MSLRILKEGILSTIQDLGRFGYRRFGINPNGVMDRTAARLINIILGNDEREAVLEMHFPAAELEFEKAAFFAIGGGDFKAELSGKPVENWRVIHAKKGDVLSFYLRISGNRTYLTIAGGFKIQKWLVSASTNLAANIGGYEGRRLHKGDRLHYKVQKSKLSAISNLRVGNSVIPLYSDFPTVRVTAGAEFDELTAVSHEIFLNETFAVSGDSNRMGFRLKGPPLHLLDRQELLLLSSAVGFGTIQLLPDGQLIVLMADHQTSGGYPRIAHIVERDLSLLAQLGQNDKVAFHSISSEGAENLQMEFEKELNFLKTGCKLSSGR